jgi:serine protease Do
MSKKSILAAIFLIFVGIVFGAILVSNFHNGVLPGFAGDPQVKLGAPVPVKDSQFDPKTLSRAFIEVSKAVTPTVVSITVTTKAKTAPNDMNEFFHFFSPNQKMPEAEQMQAAGSGVIISPDGYILTNNHVVEDADENKVEVNLNNSHKAKAKIIGTDPSTDLAVIKIDGKDFPTAALGNSDNLEIGEWVLAIGNPLGLQGTVTAGIISAIGRNGLGIIRDEKGYGIENFIQTDAAINPGNSGGPLVNLHGEVIGINSAIATTNARYQGYGFAIPINLAQAVAEDLIKHGKIVRGYIGVNIGQIDETSAKALKLDSATGVLVQSVVEGGAAMSAGIKEGDVILSIDGKEMTSPAQLQSFIARKHPGDAVKLKLFRDGTMSDKTVTLKARADDKVAAQDDRKDTDEEETNSREQAVRPLALGKIGLSIRPLTGDEKKQFAVEGGVLVTDVVRFSEAYNRSIIKGDLILEADRQKISTPKQFQSLVEKRKSGDALLLRIKRETGQMAYIAVQIPN